LAAPAPTLDGLPVPLERDLFLRTLVRELATVLEEVVGLDEARGFVSLVGRRMGEQIDSDYRNALGVDRLTPEHVAAVLVDLKTRIKGDFRLVEMDDDRMLFTSTACPFAEKVDGRPAMCMMTSNVFGTIAADNLGYAKVELGDTIATGASTCRVTVHLRPTAAAAAASGQEYFGDA